MPSAHRVRGSGFFLDVLGMHAHDARDSGGEDGVVEGCAAGTQDANHRVRCGMVVICQPRLDAMLRLEPVAYVQL